MRLTYRIQELTLQDKYNFIKNSEYSTYKVEMNYFYFGRESFPGELESAMLGSFRKGAMGREAGVIFLAVPEDMNPKELIRAILWTHFFMLFPVSFPGVKLSLFMQHFCGDILLDPL